MPHRTSLAVAVVLSLLVAGIVGSVGIVSGTGSGPTVGPAAIGSDSGDAGHEPGQIFGNVTEPPGAGAIVADTVRVQGEQIDNTATRGALEHELANASSDEERAASAAQYLDAGRDRLDGLQDRKAELDRARENGSMSRTTYQVRLSGLATVAGDLRGLAVGLDETASDLPADQRDAYGLEQARIDDLRQGAGQLATAGQRAFDEAFYANVSKMVERYNGNAPNSGTVVNRLLAGERVNLYVSAVDGETTLSFEVDEDGRLREVRSGARNDATLQLGTDRETMREITRSDDPEDAFERAIEDGDVSIRGVGTRSRLKWLAVDLVRSGADIVDRGADAVGDGVDAVTDATDAVGDFVGSI